MPWPKCIRRRACSRCPKQYSCTPILTPAKRALEPPSSILCVSSVSLTLRLVRHLSVPIAVANNGSNSISSLHRLCFGLSRIPNPASPRATKLPLARSSPRNLLLSALAPFRPARCASESLYTLGAEPAVWQRRFQIYARKVELERRRRGRMMRQRQLRAARTQRHRLDQPARWSWRSTGLGKVLTHW